MSWHRAICICAAMGAMTLVPAQASELDLLLESVRAEAQQQSAQNRERESRFLERKNEQSRLLREAQAIANKSEREADVLRKQIRELGEKIAERKAELEKRSGDLQGVAATLRDAATGTLQQFSSSLVSLDDPQRLSRVTALTQVSDVPSAAELESLWLELQGEATALATVQKIRVPVGTTEGDLVPTVITRYGGFSLRDPDGAYLRWRGGGAPPEVIARQPEPKLADRVIGSAGEGLIIDPTGGMLLGLQETRPSLRERVAQAGVIGLIILALGAIGLVLGTVQLVYLLFVGARVGSQMRDPMQPRANNPLGRILALRNDYVRRDFASLELAADEAVMRELPRIERLQDTVRLLAAVAPLLGLLGTVTGMIETFQAITLFGTGDPKLMAGGISQALMTTVLGLVVAVPLLFLHSIIVARSRSIVQRLDQQSAGLLATLRESEEMRGDSTGEASGESAEVPA